MGRKSGGNGRRVLGYAVIAALVLVLAGVLGAGPLGFFKKDSSPKSRGSAPGPGATTTTFLGLVSRSYSVGDCVTWDQATTGPQDSYVIDCKQRHLLEISGSVDVRKRAPKEPSEDQWDALANSLCPSSAVALLRAPLDPFGRFGITSLHPLHEAWEHGDRTIWCGIAVTATSRADRDANRLESLTGKVEGMPQARVSPVGSCWRNNDAYPVPCAGAHDYETAGSVDVTGRIAAPPAPDDSAAWKRVVGADCERIATKYLGHARTTERLGWVPIRKESWATGDRTVDCTVTR